MQLLNHESYLSSKEERTTAAAMESILALGVSARLVRMTGAAAPRMRPAVSFLEK